MKINYAALERNPRKYAKSLKISDLVHVLKLLDHYYHDKNAEKVSDEAYDILRDVLEERSPKNRYLKKIGSEVSKGKKKVKLLSFMPSLSKLKPGMSALHSFLEKGGPFFVSDKLDGISLQLVYRKGDLVQVTTRGKGKIGQDVSQAIPALKCPKRITDKKTTSVRAELVIKKRVFKEHGGDFKTDRNMGGGLLNRNEPPKELKHFDVVAYEVMEGALKGKPFSQQTKWLESQGFTAVKGKRFSKLSEAKLMKLLESRKSKTRYPIDGIVVSWDKPFTRVTSDNPRYQKAFKVNSKEDSKIATVVDVEYNISRNGILSPKIVIDPIQLGGVTVTNFTGHNLYFIKHGWPAKDAKIHAGEKKRPLGPGAKIRVIRSGDVIPYIQEVVKPARKPKLPDVEYSVDKHGKKAVVKGKTEDQKLRAITFFFSTLKIEGMKAATIKLMMDNGYASIREILNMSVEEMAELPRFTINKATTIRNNIDKGLNDLTFAKLGTASGLFQNMGEKKLDAVYEAYPEIMTMVKLPYNELVEKIRQVRGFANTADVIASGLPKFVRFVKQHNLRLRRPKTVVAKSNLLKGKAYLLTGVRDASVTDYIKANGGKLASGVKSANVLIVKDEDYENKKTETAREMGIPVVPVDKFKRKHKIR